MGFWARRVERDAMAAPAAPRRGLGTHATDPTLVPRPVTYARIAQWFEDSGFGFFTGPLGDLGGLWRGRVFSFALSGEREEILQVRAHWNRAITIERIEEVLELCNGWNADRIWPKTYLRVLDDGLIQVCAEVSVDLEHGVGDPQLDQFLLCALNSGTLLFDALDARYPDPAQMAP